MPATMPSAAIGGGLSLASPPSATRAATSLRCPPASPYPHRRRRIPHLPASLRSRGSRSRHRTPLRSTDPAKARPGRPTGRQGPVRRFPSDRRPYSAPPRPKPTGAPPKVRALAIARRSTRRWQNERPYAPLASHLQKEASRFRAPRPPAAELLGSPSSARPPPTPIAPAPQLPRTPPTPPASPGPSPSLSASSPARASDLASPWRGKEARSLASAEARADGTLGRRPYSARHARSRRGRDPPPCLPCRLRAPRAELPAIRP